MAGGAGVDDGVDFAVEILEHMCRGSGADMAEDIGAGRGDGNSGLANYLKRYRVGRHADADQRTARSDNIGNGFRAGKQQRQGSGPERFHQAAHRRRILDDELLQHRVFVNGAGNVHDDGIPGGALFGLKDARHGRRVKRIGAKSVDGFGGQGDETAGAKNLRGLSDGGLRLVSFHAGRVDSKVQGLHLRYCRCLKRLPLPAYTRSLTMAIETEIKFRVASVSELVIRLCQAGFRQQTPRAFESNVLYDTPDRRMRARTEILRIRSYAGKWTVTHKRLPDVGPGEDAHKHRVETETEVADGDVMAQVFKSLGLVEAFRYEKWRSEWTDDEGHCVIDETPIGDYAELEGSPAWIDRAAKRLGVDRTAYLTASYGRLFEQWRAEHHSDANDLTFDAVSITH